VKGLSKLKEQVIAIYTNVSPLLQLIYFWGKFFGDAQKCENMRSGWILLPSNIFANEQNDTLYPVNVRLMGSLSGLPINTTQAALFLYGCF